MCPRTDAPPGVADQGFKLECLADYIRRVRQSQLIRTALILAVLQLARRIIAQDELYLLDHDAASITDRLHLTICVGLVRCNPLVSSVYTPLNPHGCLNPKTVQVHLRGQTYLQHIIDHALLLCAKINYSSTEQGNLSPTPNHKHHMLPSLKLSG